MLWITRAALLVLASASMVAQTTRPVWMLGSHSNEITAIDYISDRDLIASGSRDGTVKIWDYNSGHLYGKIDVNAEVTSVDFSADGNRLLVGDAKGVVMVWNTATGLIDKQISDLDAPVVAARFSPDNRKIVYAAGDRIGISEYPSGLILKLIPPLSSPLRALALTQDGATIGAATADGQVLLVDVAGSAQPVPLEGSPIDASSLTFSPNGRRVVVGATGKLRIINRDTPGPLDVPFENDTVIAVAFTNDGARLVAGSSTGAFATVDVVTGQRTNWRAMWEQRSRAIAFSKEPRTLISADLDRINIWSMDSERPLRSITRHSTSVTISQDGQYIAANGGFPEVAVWDLASGDLITEIESPRHSFIALSPLGTTLAATTDSGIAIYSIPSGELLREFKVDTLPVNRLEFLPDGRLLVGTVQTSTTGLCLGGDNSYTNLTLWNSDNGDRLQTLRENRASLMSLAISDDGKALATAGPRVSCDGGVFHHPIEYIDVSKRQILPAFPDYAIDVTSVAVTSRGPLVATSEKSDLSRMLRLWDPTTGQVDTIDEGGRSHSVAFIRDGDYVASGEGDGTVRIFNRWNGEEIHMYGGYRSAQRAFLAPNSDRHLVSRTEDNTTIVWDITGQAGVAYPIRGIAAMEIATAPNPVTGSTHITFSLKERAATRIAAVAATGEEIATILDTELAAGDHSILWDAAGVPSGIYFVYVKSGGSAGGCGVVVVR